MPKSKPSYRFGEDQTAIEATAKAVQADFAGDAGEGRADADNSDATPEKRRQVNVRIPRSLVLAVERAALQRKAEEHQTLTTTTAMVEHGLRLVLAELEVDTEPNNRESHHE